MDMDATTLTVLGFVTLQAIQLAQTAVLGRVVRKSLRPPPPPSRGTPVVFEGESILPPRERADQTPSERISVRRRPE